MSLMMCFAEIHDIASQAAQEALQGKKEIFINFQSFVVFYKKEGNNKRNNILYV